MEILIVANDKAANAANYWSGKVWM